MDSVMLNLSIDQIVVLFPTSHDPYLLFPLHPSRGDARVNPSHSLMRREAGYNVHTAELRIQARIYIYIS